MRSSFLIFVSVCFATLSINAQGERYEIKQVVEELFDGMRAADTSRMRNLFAVQEMVLKTVFKDKTGDTQLHEGSLGEFLNSVGTPHDQIYDERLAAYDIQVHGLMATMQVEYYFFLGDKFSHCGVNFIELMKSSDGWKIINLSDTRNKQECEVPDETW